VEQVVHNAKRTSKKNNLVGQFENQHFGSVKGVAINHESIVC